MNNIKYLIIGLFGFMWITSCSNDTELGDIMTTKIDREDPLYKFLLSDKTMEESHNYYLNMRNERRDEEEFDNLKTIFITDLIQEKKLSQLNDKQIIAFYVEELSELDFFYLANDYSSLLLSLENFWSNEKLNQNANEFISRNNQFVEKLEYPNKLRKDPIYASGMNKISYTQQYFQFRI